MSHAGERTDQQRQAKRYCSVCMANCMSIWSARANRADLNIHQRSPNGASGTLKQPGAKKLEQKPTGWPSVSWGEGKLKCIGVMRCLREGKQNTQELKRIN